MISSRLYSYVIQTYWPESQRSRHI